jgi:hypothetical protein
LRVRRNREDRGLTAGMECACPTECQLLYRVPGFDIDIRLRPSAGSVSLSGRIVSQEGSAVGPGRVQAYLHGPEARMASLRVDEQGEFAMRELPRGKQTIEFRVDSRVSHRLSFVV